MSQRYSGKSRKDSSTMKKAKLSIREKRKIKREKKRNDRFTKWKKKIKRPSSTRRFGRSTKKKKLKI